MRRQVHYWHALISAVTRGHHTHHTTSHSALHVTRGIVTILNIRYTVTGSEAHRAAAAACTKLEKCDWHIFKKVLLDPNQAPFRPDGPRVMLWLFVSYSRAKKGKLIQAHAVLYLKGEGCLFDRRRLLTQNLNTLKCTIKHFINWETQHSRLDCIMINL